MTAWRTDMENARKDGHRLLLGGINDGIGWATIGHWSPFDGAWMDDWGGDIKAPTHWQPLEPPQ